MDVNLVGCESGWIFSMDFFDGFFILAICKRVWYSSSMTDIMEALQNQLTERQRRNSSNVERIWSRKQIEQAFLETFELIGGVPRLAIWANDPENYHLFLQLLLKMAPKEAASATRAAVIEYRSNVPQSSLNTYAVEDVTDVE